MTTIDWKQLLIAAAFLMVGHSLISFTAFRLLSKEIMSKTTQKSPQEITTFEQREKGITTFKLQNTVTRVKLVPSIIVIHLFFGYSGIVCALLLAFYKQIAD